MALVLNSKNPNHFVEDTVYSLSVGFQNIPLSSKDKIHSRGSIRKLSKYSILVADTVVIKALSSVLMNLRVDICPQLSHTG